MKSLARNTSVLIIIAYLNACVSTAPLDNTPFISASNINQFEGVYLNRGDAGPNESAVHYLSRIIWPNDYSIVHVSIETIEFKRLSKHELSVKGLRGDVIVKSAVCSNKL